MAKLRFLYYMENLHFVSNLRQFISGVSSEKCQQTDRFSLCLLRLNPTLSLGNTVYNECSVFEHLKQVVRMALREKIFSGINFIV